MFHAVLLFSCLIQDVNQALVGRKNTTHKTDVVSSSCATGDDYVEVYFA